jgi:hypothetical protein
LQALTKLRRLVLSLFFLSLPALVATANPASAVNGGPVVLTGIDAEDCGPNGHGPIGNYVSLVNSILSNTSNGGDGILVIGANGSGPQAFWNAIGAGTGEAITFGNENSSFAGFQMIAVVGSAPETCGGLTQAQNDVLASRQLDFANFINSGGGLLGNTQSNFNNQYAYIGGLGSFSSATVSQFDQIDPTPEGQAVGITDALDVCCWHNIFTQFPSFLEVLAFRGGTQDAVAIGGQNVIVTVGIELSPASATNPAGTDHTVTATVKDSNSVPQPGVPVSFSVTAGPNTGETSDPAECVPAGCTTDANGNVSWTYTSNGQTGTDTITASFTDDQGNARSAQASKEWVNNPPDCSAVAPSTTSLWPPNHKMVEVSLSGATDPDGDPVTITITGVTQDEPLDGLGDGDTAPDAQAGSASDKVLLRAERAGKGDGRVYRIAYTASDPAGATCSGVVTVGVPRDQGPNGGPVDSGLVVNSFGP